MNKLTASFILLLVSACYMGSLFADDEMTPLGAERAGNAAGTIPAWTGGLQQPPATYRAGYHEANPFPDDEPLFQINATNAGEYANNLTPGQLALLAKYPDTWHLNVYQSRRSASYPDYVYAALADNAKSARVLRKGRGGVLNSRVTSPFPSPKTGVEAVWNHNLHFRGVRVNRYEGTAAVTRAGNYQLTLSRADWAFPYASPAPTPFKTHSPNVSAAVKTKIVEPPLLAGDGTLLIDTINQTQDPRKSWLYSRSLRRVLRTPLLGYELPAPRSDGLRTTDDVTLFNGPPDRFEWKLIGKKEVYIPYNAYLLHGPALTHKDIVRKGHIAPEHARYELHRVWVVEGVLKKDVGHVFGKRVLYMDEDSWQVVLAENYNKKGALWRVNEGHVINYYTVPMVWTTLEVYHDLLASRVLIEGLDNQNTAYQFLQESDPREFSPTSLLYYLR